MVIKNACVFIGNSFRAVDIEISSGVISHIGSGLSGDALDLEGLYLLPGLVDIHTHGIGGFDFNTANEEQMQIMERQYIRSGTTSLCPTLLPMSDEGYIAQTKYASALKSCRGIHLEGPFISYNKKGAINGDFLRNGGESFFVKLASTYPNTMFRMTAAPEAVNSDILYPLIQLSMGHTNASFELAEAALNGHFSSVTHMFNAMPQLHHRSGSATLSALDSHAIKELICDGVHISDGLIRTMLSRFDNEIALVSDSISACLLNDGDYTLGGLAVKVCGGRATLPDGTLAGSCSTLLDCVRHCIEIGCNPSSVINAATSVPARLIGADAGEIAAGKPADLIALDRNFALTHVIYGGLIVPHN